MLMAHTKVCGPISAHDWSDQQCQNQVSTKWHDVIVGKDVPKAGIRFVSSRYCGKSNTTVSYVIPSTWARLVTACISACSARAFTEKCMGRTSKPFFARRIQDNVESLPPDQITQARFEPSVLVGRRCVTAGLQDNIWQGHQSPADLASTECHITSLRWEAYY